MSSFVSPPKEQPDTKSYRFFPNAKLTGNILDLELEANFQKRVGQAIDFGNILSGYRRKELSELTDISSSQYSKAIQGNSCINPALLGLWSFATGISITDLIALDLKSIRPSQAMAWFINGRLHNMPGTEFFFLLRFIGKRFDIDLTAANEIQFGPTPNLKSKIWKEEYIADLNATVSNNVLRLRQQLGISPIEFGEAMGINTETVKRYESGTAKISKGVYAPFQLLTAFDVTPLEITKGSLHHELRQVQIARHAFISNILQRVPSKNHAQIKQLIVHASKIGSSV